MNIMLAADHRGYQLKEKVKTYLIQAGYQIVDCGASSYMPEDDYVDYAETALSRPSFQPEDRALLFCGSGHGMDIVANRMSYIRAILGFNPDVVEQGRQHEDANVLVVPSDWTTENQVKILVDTFLNTPFSKEERHVRRLNKLTKIHLG